MFYAISIRNNVTVPVQMDGSGMEGGYAADEGMYCPDMCNCCLWLLICLTCPISLPLMAMWWCCQSVCPMGTDDCCFCFNQGEEGMGFAGYADTI